MQWIASVRTHVVCAGILAAACIGAWASPALAQGGPACASFQPKEGDVSQPGTWAGGRETTEALGNGVYRVTRCNADGTLNEAMEVGPVHTGDGSSYPAPLAITTPHGATVATLSITYTADAVEPAESQRMPVLAPTGGTAPNGEAASPEADDSCTNSEYHLLPGGPFFAYSGYYYSTNVAGATTSGASLTDMREGIINGHGSWNSTINTCGYTDQNNINAVWSGTTTRHWNLSDGYSTSDFGSLPAIGMTDPNAIAVENYSWISCGGVYRCMLETDQRFSTARTWSVCGVCTVSFDIWAVAAHESGHSLGLDHANSSDWLTMYYAESPASNRHRSLARGDVLGMRQIYANH